MERDLPLPDGKLSPEILERLLAYTSGSPELSVGAACGEDAAVARGAETIVITADPVTFSEENIGVYAVAVNANDIVAMGGRPRYLTTTILLPRGATAGRCERIFAEISGACEKAGILWVGGHTEVTSAVCRVVVSGHAVGFLSREPLGTDGARAGDLVCMTKWVGLEGTTLIARERPADSRRLLGEASYLEVLAWLEKPGISIVEEGRALDGLALTSGHDPTEGGVAMGIHEICRRSGTGAVVFSESLPIREETRRLCDHFNLDPMGLLSSGVFLFTAPPDVAEQARGSLADRGIRISVIGEIRPKKEGVLIRKDGKALPMKASVQDEIVKLPPL